MKNEQIKKIALACGFELKEQPTGELDLNPYVYDFARELIKQNQQSAWVSVNDEPPEKDGNYITYQVRHLWGNYYEKEVTQARFEVETGFGIAQGVTHWQTLPEPPTHLE